MTTSAAKANRRADIVDRLEAEIEHLREALERVADHDRSRPGLGYPSLEALIDSAVAIAKAALNIHKHGERL